MLRETATSRARGDIPERHYMTGLGLIDVCTGEPMDGLRDPNGTDDSAHTGWTVRGSLLRATPWWFRIYIGAFALLCLLNISAWGFRLILLLIVAWVIGKWFDFRTVVLVASEAGLERINSRRAYRIQVPWTDVTALRIRRHGLSRYWALEYRERPLLPLEGSTAMPERVQERARKKGIGTHFSVLEFVGPPQTGLLADALRVHRPDLAIPTPPSANNPSNGS